MITKNNNKILIEPDTKDFLDDLERAAYSPDASDAWIAGFVRQYFISHPSMETIMVPMNTGTRRATRVVTMLASTVAFALFSLSIWPQSTILLLVWSVIGAMIGYTAIRLDPAYK